MAYGKLIRRAWDVTWRHKVLWIFGVVAAVFAGTSGSGSVSRSIQYVLDSNDRTWMNDVLGPRYAGTVDWNEIVGIIGGVAAAALVFGIVSYVVGLVARYTSEGALIAGVDEVERTGSTRFHSALRGGWLRMIWLLLVDLALSLARLILLLPVALILLIGLALVIGPAVALGTAGGNAAVVAGVMWGAVTFLMWFAVTIVVSVAVSGALTVLREYAFRAVALDGRGLFEAIGDAWRLARRTLRPTFTMWLLLSLVNLVLGALLVPVVLGIMAAVVAAIVAAFSATESVILPVLLSVPALLILAVLSTGVAGIYSTFRSAAWTLAYRELKQEPLPVVQGTSI